MFNIYCHRHFLMFVRTCMYFTSTFAHFFVHHFSVHFIFVHIALSCDFTYQWVFLTCW